jgi:DNA polymerase delta subunit 2
MAALGMETSSGDFEVIDLCFAGLPDLLRPEAGPSNDVNRSSKGKDRAKEDIVVDGRCLRSLDFRAKLSRRRFGEKSLIREDMGRAGVRLVSWRARSTCGSQGGTLGRMVDRRDWWTCREPQGVWLDLGSCTVGPVRWRSNSPANPRWELIDNAHTGRGRQKTCPSRQLNKAHRLTPDQKRFNNASKPLYPSHPTKSLSTLLTDLLASALPVNLIPGPSDPAGATLPQQPLPKVMIGGKKMQGLECATNPSWMEIGGRRSVLLLAGWVGFDATTKLPRHWRADIRRHI